MVFKKRSGLQRSVFSQAFHIFRPFFKVPLKFPHYQKQQPQGQPFQLLVDIPQKMAAGKSFGYKKWATKFNLKEMSKTLLFFTGAENRQCRGTARTYSGGNGTLLSEQDEPRLCAWFTESGVMLCTCGYGLSGCHPETIADHHPAHGRAHRCLTSLCSLNA